MNGLCSVRGVRCAVVVLDWDWGVQWGGELARDCTAACAHTPTTPRPDALDARLARWDAAQRAFLDARPDDVLAETERPPAV